MDKIAVFYMIGQYGAVEDWKALFNDQMNLIKETGLYENIQFIDIFVKGMAPIPLEEFPDKVNNITYFGDLEEHRPTNGERYRAYNQIMQRMWTFSNANPEYKVLFFHSIGVSHTSEVVKHRTKLFREYMETLNVKYWKDCLQILNHYDCVGTDYIQSAVFGPNGEYCFEAPHYQGFFWWANASYLKTLNPCYFYQDVPWQQWLCELWIGSGNPKAYNFYTTQQNRYYHDIDPVPYDVIIELARKHLMALSLNQTGD